jgi:tRNA dimethylallyltransferase
MHSQLAAVDPEAARRIHPNDPQRLQRALEVFRVSGRTMTELHEPELDAQTDLPFRLVFTALVPEPRADLHARIARRFHAMLRQGLVEEVETLFARGDLSEDLPAIKSVGYRQVWRYLAGHNDYDEMVERGIIATRQLAKRQYTWLRSWPELVILDGQSEKSLEKLLNIVDSASI